MGVLDTEWANYPESFSKLIQALLHDNISQSECGLQAAEADIIPGCQETPEVHLACL